VAAVAGLIAVRSDAERIWNGLTSGWGLAAVIGSALAGAATVLLVFRRRYEPARVTAATAVAAIIAGWGIAQRPRFLPGLTIQEAAAGRSTLISLLVSLGLGALILIPSLGRSRRSSRPRASASSSASSRRSPSTRDGDASWASRHSSPSLHSARWRSSRR
jgi:hypothetical protein